MPGEDLGDQEITKQSLSSLLPSQGHCTILIILRRETDFKATSFVVVFFSNPHLQLTFIFFKIKSVPARVPAHWRDEL